MRSDDRAASGKADTKPKNDISAEDLLKLLHESVENTPERTAGSKPDKSGTDNKSVRKPAKPLEIDEGIYSSARSELLSDKDGSDDDELDIDALINKYIRRPKPAADETYSDGSITSETVPAQTIVKQIEPAEPLRSHADGIEPDADSGYKSAAAGTAAAGGVSGSAGYSVADTVTDTVADTVTDSVADDIIDDVKVFDKASPRKKTPAAGPLAETAEAGDDNGRTAVFDIKKVRDAVDEPNAEFEQIVDQAFQNAATEVFTPVHTGLDTGEQPSEETAGTKTYGEPDADEIDQTDLNLMIAFGMNDELKEKVGEKKASEIEADIEKKHEETAQLQAVSGKQGADLAYTSRNQNNDILLKYKSQYYTLILRIAAAVVLFGATFLLENCSLLGLTLPSFLKPDSYPVVFAMVDLQFIVLCGALVYRQIVDGVKNLVLLKPTPESLTAFSLIISAVYTCTACFIAPRQGFALYNLPVTVAVLLALIYEFMRLKRDVFSFNVISSKKKKFVVSPVSGATESLEREIFSDYIPGESKIIRVGKTDFVDGFFSRVNGNTISRPTIGIIIPIVLILAVAFFILTFFKNQSVYESMTMAFITVSVTMPLTAFIIYSYPFYKAAREAYDCDSTIIGEVSLNDYAGSSVISFEDKEVFPSGGVKVTSIKVYGNNRIDEIIYNLASAFITVGGPLADVFSQATHDLGHSDSVTLEEVEDDGFTVTIDDIQVNIGKASYMEKQDFDPPYDAEDKRIESATSVGILYIAYQGQLAAKVYVQYTIDNEFEQILAQLYKTGMCVGIKSFDPNIDDLLLAKKIKAMKYPVKVIRSKTVEDIPHTFERCDSGIVSKRSVKDLLKTVALCERVNGVIKTNLVIKVLALLIGVLVMVFVYSFGSEITITSLYTALYQLFWVIPVLIISRLFV